MSNLLYLEGSRHLGTRLKGMPQCEDKIKRGWRKGRGGEAVYPEGAERRWR